MTDPSAADEAELRAEGEELAAEIELFSAERLIFFTDAVVAIAITLLAFDLPLPKGASDLLLLRSAGQHTDSYLVFLISFAVIGNYWRLHHRAFRYVARVSNRVAGLNLAWLLLIIVVPFATRVLTLGNGAFGVRFSFYAAIQVLIAITSWVLIRLLYRDGLLRTQAPQAYRHDPRLLVLAGTFAISIPLSFLPSVGRAAYACWVAAPMITVLAKRWQERRTGFRLPG